MLNNIQTLKDDLKYFKLIILFKYRGEYWGSVRINTQDIPLNATLKEVITHNDNGGIFVEAELI